MIKSSRSTMLGWSALGMLIISCVGGPGGTPDRSPAGAQRRQGVEPPCTAPALVGRWELRRAPPANGLIRVELMVDSPAADSFRVNLTFLMVGNVGLDASAFVTTVGRITGDCTVRLSIRRSDEVSPVGLIEGELDGDAIAIETWIWGGSPQTRDGIAWTLERIPSHPGRV